MVSPRSVAWCSPRGWAAIPRFAVRSAPMRSSRSCPGSPWPLPEPAPAMQNHSPASRSEQETTMVNTIPYASQPALAELPPLPVGALAYGAVELLDEALDLPQPRYMTVSSTQRVGLQFDNNRSSFAAITKWALRFGGVLTST